MTGVCGRDLRLVRARSNWLRQDGLFTVTEFANDSRQLQGVQLAGWIGCDEHSAANNGPTVGTAVIPQRPPHIDIRSAFVRCIRNTRPPRPSSRGFTPRPHAMGPPPLHSAAAAFIAACCCLCFSPAAAQAGASSGDLTQDKGGVEPTRPAAAVTAIHSLGSSEPPTHIASSLPSLSSSRIPVAIHVRCVSAITSRLLSSPLLNPCLCYSPPHFLPPLPFSPHLPAFFPNPPPTYPLFSPPRPPPFPLRAGLAGGVRFDAGILFAAPLRRPTARRATRAAPGGLHGAHGGQGSHGGAGGGGGGAPLDRAVPVLRMRPPATLGECWCGAMRWSE
ncbi:unnamed protein product, partial [Closterium sp. NIES-54]